MSLSLGYINSILREYDESGTKKKGAFWRRTNMSADALGKPVPLKNVPGLDDNRPNAAGSYYSFAKTLHTILYTYIHREINSFPRDALSVGELMLDPIYNKSNAVRGYRRFIDILINTDVLWRDSLWNTSDIYRKLRRNWRNNRAAPYWDETRRKYGISNIVLLFEYGWNARGRVKGKWHDQTCWNRVNAPGRYMINEAIAFFNRTTPKGVTAQVSPAYRSKKERW